MPKIPAIASALVVFIFMSSCSKGPQAIQIGRDACEFCKMTFADNKFGGEIITLKNKVYKFDDMHCLLSFKKANLQNPQNIKDIYLVRYDSSHGLIEASKTYLLRSDQFHSPMEGNIAAFSDINSLKIVSEKFKGSIVSWDELNK